MTYVHVKPNCSNNSNHSLSFIMALHFNKFGCVTFLRIINVFLHIICTWLDTFMINSQIFRFLHNSSSCFVFPFYDTVLLHVNALMF